MIRLKRIAVATAIALGLIAPGAHAYWSGSGEGSGSASLATLSPPAITSVTPGADTVELEWSPVTPPGPGVVEYYVTRDGGAPGSGCPGSSSPSTTTRCTDTGVSIGTHQYTVTAVWRSWTAESTTSTVSVTFGAATHFQVEAASSTPTAGEADDLTITAKDAAENTDASYSGTHSLIFEGPSEAPNATKPVVIDQAGVASKLGQATPITFSEGKATVSGSANGALKLYDAQTTSLQVKEGSIEGASGSLTVKAGTARRLSVPTPSEREAGAAFNLTLTALDEWGNVATGYAGAKALAFSEPADSPSGKAPSYPASVTFTAGVGTASSIKLYDAQTTTLEASEGAIEGVSGSFLVKAGPSKKLSVTTPSEQEAGAAFNVALTAIDEWGNTAKTYTGARTLTWSGPSSSPSGQAPEYPASATTVSFSEGAATASAIKLYDAQSTTLKAKEGSIEGISGSFTVKAAAPASLSVSTPSEPTAGAAFNETVTALDAWHNAAKTYTGARTLTWSGPSSSPSGQAPEYPSSATTVSFSEGAGTASAIKLYAAQTTALKVNEGSLSGTSGSFAVKAGTTTDFTMPTPAEQQAGVAFSVTLTATDEWGNLAKTYAGSKKLTFSEPSDSPDGQAPSYPAAVTFSEGVGTASAIKLYDAQNTQLKVKLNTVEGSSGSFTVDAGAAEHLAWSQPEVTSGGFKSGSSPFDCTTTSIGHGALFKARVSVTDAYGNIVSNLGATITAKVEKASGGGTLANSRGLTIPASGPAESSASFEYTSPTSGSSEAVLALTGETGTAYTEAEAHIKY
ncbi:MAG TPA: hypothetical protein VMF09_05955 [Solirubrobacteraceae bacterium]|nr:hypothetical protein [Solirubrobacteraceae bacterium]